MTIKPNDNGTFDCNLTATELLCIRTLSGWSGMVANYIHKKVITLGMSKSSYIISKSEHNDILLRWWKDTSTLQHDIVTKYNLEKSGAHHVVKESNNAPLP